MSHADRMLTGQQSQGKKTEWKPLATLVTAQHCLYSKTQRINACVCVCVCVYKHGQTLSV